MTPDDLDTVQRSWTHLREHRTSFLDRLAVALAGRLDAAAAAGHARRLVDATDELIDLLATPSHLARRAHEIVSSWVPGAAAPDLDIDGAAWLSAAAEVSPTWSGEDVAAWRRAWLLLGDVVAAETLAPFGSASQPRLPT